MAIIFSPKQIPALKELSISERNHILQQAKTKLTTPQKLILNLLKLFMLVPPFIYLARLSWAELAMAVGVSFTCYFLAFRPISLNFLIKNINNSSIQ